MKTVRKIITLLTVIIVVCAGLFVAYKFTHMFDFLKRDLSIEKTTNVVEEVKKIGEFTTACYYEEVPLRDIRIDTIKREGLLGIGAGKSFKENEIVLIGKGRVRAGFDLAKVKDGDMNVHGDTLEMKLPRAELFDIIMNPSDFTTEYESGTWSHELTKPLKERAKADLEKNAIDYGILQKAEESGLKRLELLFKTFGYNTVLLTIYEE